MKSQESIAILSHRKDADGLSSAAILRIAMPKSTVYLSDYSDMVETIREIGSPQEFFIADLALNDGSFPDFLSEMKRLGQAGTKIQYIDHHVLKSEFETALKECGVDVYHFTEESAAVLAFQKHLPQIGNPTQAKILASCGAITDLMDGGSVARKLISSFDRQFLLYEATVLAFTISMVRKEKEGGAKNEILLDIVERLAEGDLPHAIPGAIEYCQAFAQNASETLERLKSEGKKAGSFGYVKTSESSTGNVAYALIGALNVPVGMAYREDGPDNYEVSLRATEDYRGDLSQVVGKAAKALYTSGGGHAKASGIRIKRDQLEDLIALLRKELS